MTLPQCFLRIPAAVGRSCLYFILAIALSVALSSGLLAADAKVAFDVPAGDASQTLKNFAQQAGRQIVYQAEAVRGAQTAAVKGEYSVKDAIDRMLAGTGLQAVQDEQTGALAVNRADSISSANAPEKDTSSPNVQRVAQETAGSHPIQAIEASNGPSAGYGMAAPQPASAVAVAPASGEAAIKLPEFDVLGKPVDPYNGAEALSAARTAAKILDTPMTINVLTPALIQDINPMAMSDMTEYFAGISPGRATGSAGFADRQELRGYENFSRSVDNFTDSILPLGSAPDDQVDPVLLDHVELIMGPDTILSPSGTPGGTISAFTKSPLFTPGIDISAKVGNYNANRVTVDATGPLGDGKHMAYRVIAAYQDAYQYVPGTEIDWAAAAMFTYKFSDTARLMVKYYGISAYRGGADCDQAANGEEVYTPDTVGGATISDTPQPGFQYRGWNGDGTWAKRITRDNKAEAELTAALGEYINMRLAACVYWTLDNAQTCWPVPVLNETYNPQTGQVISVTPFNPASVPETSYLEQNQARQEQVQNDFAGNFKVGTTSLAPVVGWAYTQAEMPVATNATLPANTLPACNIASGVPYAPPIPLNSAYTVNSSDTPEEGVSMQVYAYLRAGFLNDRVFVSGGASRTWANVNDYTLPYAKLPGGWGVTAGNPNGTVIDAVFSHTNNALAPSVQPWYDTYMAGIVGKVTSNVAVYYNFSTNAQLASAVPQWQAGRQHEFGVKANFFDNRISISADHFQIAENNVAFTNPLFILNQSTIFQIYSDLVNRGEEVNITGGITKDLSVIASYTNQKLRDTFGRQRRNTPDTMANLLLDYHFDTPLLKNSDIFIGANHVGKVAGETESGFTSLGVPEQPGFFLPAFTVWNGGAGYRLGNYRFNLDVTNLFNQKFWWQACGRTCIVPYPCINITLTVTVHI